MSAHETDKPSIREARKVKKLSQQDLAQSAGCSIAYIRMIEGGYVPGSTVSPVYLQVLETLGLSLDKLPGGDS